MRKIIFFSLILFLLLCPVSAAFEDTIERYGSSWQEKYYLSNSPLYCDSSSVAIQTDTAPSTNHYIKVSMISTQIGQGYAVLVPYENSSSPYLSISAISNSLYDSQANGRGLCVLVVKPDDNTILAACYGLTNPSDAEIHRYKIEVIKNGGYYDIYRDGTLLKSVANSNPSYNGDVKYCVGVGYDRGGAAWATTCTVGFDDITDSSIIGFPLSINEAGTYGYTWSAQLMRSYTDPFKISLYSLTNTNNVGKIKDISIPGGDNSSSAEYGYILDNRSALLGNNYGLYVLEMTRGSTILKDQYFYYDQLANPHGSPALLFLATSDVETTITDDSNDGGELPAGGGSVYLYPAIKTNGIYNIYYDIEETPYAFSTEISKIYNSSSINGTYIYYTGLSAQNYKVSLDGQGISSTNGSDTWNYSLSWDSTDSHIISFAPDYNLSGVWGEVKDSVTQAGIKSATVSITGDSFAKTIYTDDNGLFYLTQGMGPNKTYSIAPTKTGYNTPPAQSAITVNGATTRQDFFMDPIESVSGSGLYYAPHTVTFLVYEYWYNTTGLPGCSYSVVDENGTAIKTGTTDSKGQFAIKDMDPGIKYTITLNYNGSTDIEYITPGLTEYTLILNKESAIVQNYINPWLTLTYTKNLNNATIHYESNKTIAGGGALLAATAGNGSQVYSQTLSTNNGTFLFNFTNGTDYILSFNITAGDGSTASQNWIISSPVTVTLFPASYPIWLKNLLFVGICIIFLLAFGKARNEIACGSVAVLSALGYYFHWLTCSYYFVVLIWIIALGAFVLHYKRTGALG